MSDLGENSSTNEAKREEDIFTILVATDIHLGFAEKDPIRGEDTFDTFEEILQIAVKNDVDFILLGGDLFHQANPSYYCSYKCNQLLTKYCQGDKPVAIEFLSDSSSNLTSAINNTVNYENPNINISYPVFSIHGNHDDPTGQRQISALDGLASVGLVNYFGRFTSHEKIKIEPILLRKGKSKLALYGLSHVKDERLARLFVENKVTISTDSTEGEWFNLLVLHQNRAVRGLKNFIPETVLPGFLDLVIWGHEHDNRLQPEHKSNDIYISQPGSSVATSLSLGESIPKQVGILKICGEAFKMTPVDLKTVRPFIFKEINLKTPNEMLEESTSGRNIAELSSNFVKQKIEDMIEESETLGRRGRASELPLIRLNVRYTDDRQVFNTIRFGQSYIGRVANPDDMLKFHPIKERTAKGQNSKNFTDDIPHANLERVEDIVMSYFEENDTLKVLPYNVINVAVKKFVDSENNDAISLVYDEIKKETIKKLSEDKPELNDLEKYLSELKLRKQQDNVDTISKALDNSVAQKAQDRSELNLDSEMVTVDSDDEDVVIIETSRGRGRGARRGRAGGRVTRTPRGKAPAKKKMFDL